jgi:hypothetical protein
MNKSHLFVCGVIGAAALGAFALSGHKAGADDPSASVSPTSATGTVVPEGDGSTSVAAAVGPYEAEHGDADCTQDCSGHEAGYKWAEENDISDEDDCTGNSESFIEGCKAYVADNGD